MYILLDCPHDYLVRLRTQQQLIFPPQFEDGPARLRTFMNQPDIFGVASFVANPVPLIFLAFFWFGYYRVFSKLPLRCPPEAYITM
jgi:hypothetical protein